MNDDQLDLDELLKQEVIKKRDRYNSKLIEDAQNDLLTPQSAIYQGFDADSGLAIVVPLGGKPLKVASPITNGAIKVGQSVQISRRGSSVFMDALPAGWRSLAGGGGGSGTGKDEDESKDPRKDPATDPNSGNSGDGGGTSGAFNPFCGYKLIGGECVAQTDCVEGDPTLFSSMLDCIEEKDKLRCSNNSFGMTAPITYTAPSGNVIQSVRIVDGSWQSGTFTNLGCPPLQISGDRTSAAADFDTNYGDNSGTCTYRICLKTQDNVWGCVEFYPASGGEPSASCVYFPDGTGSYKTLEECEKAISPSFEGGQCEDVLYKFTLYYKFSPDEPAANYLIERALGPIEGVRTIRATSSSGGYVDVKAKAIPGRPDRGDGWWNLILHSITDEVYAEIRDLERMDGQPDTCGNARKRCP